MHSHHFVNSGDVTDDCKMVVELTVPESCEHIVPPRALERMAAGFWTCNHFRCRSDAKPCFRASTLY